MDKGINRFKVVLAEKKRTNNMVNTTIGLCTNNSLKMVSNACQSPMEMYLKIAKLLEVKLDVLLNKRYVTAMAKDNK